jgi:hypothetical protein
MILLGCVAVGGVAGCATREPVEPVQMVYTPPSGKPGGMSTIRRNGDAGQWLERASTNLRDLGFTVTHTDPVGGFVVATRSIPPRDGVDCGWIVEAGTSGSRELHHASEPDLAVDIYEDGELIQARRSTDLDTRVVVVARQVDEERTELTSRAAYVVVRKTRGPDEIQDINEVIYFGSGESASFDKGTTCQPTGTLERAVLAQL